MYMLILKKKSWFWIFLIKESFVIEEAVLKMRVSTD